MNRPIKFRAYDEVEKKMYSPVELFNLHGFWWEDTPEGELQGALIVDSYGNRRHFKLMQYTGVPDKNGREIYEGDKLQYGKVCGIVSFCAGNFVCEYDDQTDEPLSYMRTNDLEVIGNIFEINIS